MELGDNVCPIYKFEWDDGTVRRTDEIEGFEEVPVAIESLAKYAEEEKDGCEVTLVGYAN